MIQLCELTKYYGETVALSEVSFSTGSGEIVGLLGPNGAGKSTLMRILVGNLSPTKGQAFVGGLDVTSHSLEVRRQLGYLPESNGLYLEMRVREYLKHRATLKEISATGKAIIEEAVEACGLTEVQHRIIGHLSKGYRQRVGLAAAILGKPPLLILDEPTVGLDPLQMREIRELVREIGRERTVLFSTHILSEAEALCDRIVIIDTGRKLLDASVDDLRKSSSGSWLELEVAASVRNVQEALAPVQDVTVEVLEESNIRKFCIRSDKRPFDITLRTDISTALTTSGLVILSLHLRTPSLDDVFARLTGEEGAV